jgi:hypothetical protein
VLLVSSLIEHVCSINETTAKRVRHRSGAAFAEEDARASRSNVSRFAAHIFEVLCAPGVSTVRFCSEVINASLSDPAKNATSCLLQGIGLLPRISPAPHIERKQTHADRSVGARRVRGGRRVPRQDVLTGREQEVQ